MDVFGRNGSGPEKGGFRRVIACGEFVILQSQLFRIGNVRSLMARWVRNGGFASCSCVDGGWSIRICSERHGAGGNNSSRFVCG